MSKKENRRASAFSVFDRIGKEIKGPTESAARVRVKEVGENSRKASVEISDPERLGIGAEHIYVETDKIIPWEFANRIYFDPNVIESLKASFSSAQQRQPALVRPLDIDNPRSNGGQYEYELIYGAQRLQAAHELGMALLVVVADISDREAAIEMDAENRARSDITTYERARDYARWKEQGLFKSAPDICRATGLNRTTVFRLLQIARLPPEVGNAFSSPAELSFSFGYDLAAKMGDDMTSYDAVKRCAIELSHIPAGDMDSAARSRRLMASLAPAKKTRSSKPSRTFDIKPRSIHGADGKSLARLNVSRKGEIRIRTRQMSSPETAEEVISRLERLVADALNDI